MRQCAAPPENAVRWLDIELPEYTFGLGVLHIPVGVPGSKDPSRGVKTRFWSAVLAAAESRIREPFLFVGDLNTGAHRIDEAGKTFICAEHFNGMSTLGWTDLWRHHNSGPTEYTWYSRLKGGRRGNGFRVDHAFATPSLLARVEGCRYSHAERESGISDHSVLTVELK